MDIKISENLRALRIKSKRSLEDVAEIIDVSRQSVSKWESGESYPDIEKCVRLAKLYNVSLDALVNKTISELVQGESKENQYMFGLTKLEENGTIKLPKKAIEVFEITAKDALLVVGDKNQRIAIVKCGGVNDFIDKIGFIPVKFGPSGKTLAIDLIFEK